MTIPDFIANITIRDIVGFVASAAVVVSGVVQFSKKIHFRPWSWIAKMVGRSLNGEVLNEVSAVKNDVAKMDEIVSKLFDKVHTLQADRDEDNAERYREQILSFGDELIYDETKRHTKERFDEILAIIRKYNSYCETHPSFPNGRTEETAKYIVSTYDSCMEKHNFL